MRRVALCLAITVAALPASAADAPMRFWNLTTARITRLTLAPPGSDAWGPNQCANDRDGSVDHDERLRITGVAPGRYDVQLVQDPGRTCTVRNVELKPGGKYAFSLSDSDLTDCK